MKRRKFITLLGGAAVAWPLAARAQQSERPRRVGVLMNVAADDPLSTLRVSAFAQAMQELGWTVGRNLRIDYRWGQADPDRLRKYAAELVTLAPEVIVSNANPSTTALQQATRNVPIVFVNQVDPIGAGFVESLARPGGNITGFTNFEYGLSAKWLELLKEIAPRVTRVAVLRDPTSASGTGQLGAIQSVAPSFGVELRPVDIRDPDAIERAVVAITRLPNSGMIVTGTGLALSHQAVIVRLASSTASLRSPHSAPMWSRASCSHTSRTLSIHTVALPDTSIASSRGRSRPICRYRRRPNSSLSSTSRPPRRSASTFRQRCSAAPTR